MGRPAVEAGGTPLNRRQQEQQAGGEPPAQPGFWQELRKTIRADSHLRLPIVRGAAIQKKLFQVHVWIKAGGNLRVVDPASGGETSDVNAYCVCEVANQPSRNVRTETMEGTGDLHWNHEGKLTDFGQDDSLDFNVWDDTQFIGHCHLSNQRTFAGFEGDLPLAGGMVEGGQLAVRVQVFPQRPTSGPSDSARTGQAHGVGTSHGRLPTKSGAKQPRPLSATASCTWPRSERAASEPPASRLVYKPTDKKHGPERLYFDLGLPPPGEGTHAGSRSRGGDSVGLNRHPLQEFTRPGLSGGGQASPKWKRPRSADGRLEHYVNLGRPTDPKKGPECLYYNSSKYTGTAKLGGPSVQQTGVLRQVVALGSLRLPNERAMPFPRGNADKYRLFVRRGEYEGRPYFEQAGGSGEHLYLYCHPQERPEPDKWCISDTLGDQPSQAWASASGDTSKLPPGGQWNTNTKRAAGLVRVTTEEMYVASLGQVVRPNVSKAHSKAAQLAYATRLSQTKKPAAQTKTTKPQSFQEATANSGQRKLLPRIARPTSAGGGASGRCSSRTRGPRPTNPSFGPERLYYDYVAAASQTQDDQFFEEEDQEVWGFQKFSLFDQIQGGQASTTYPTFGSPVPFAAEGPPPPPPPPLDDRTPFSTSFSASRSRTLRVVR